MINEKNEEYFQMIRDFTLFSDFFMYEVFSRNRSAATLMTRILTGKDHLMIKKYGMEVKKGFPFFRHVRYDLFVEDTKNNVYNFEIENKQNALGQRAMMNLSILVSQRLKKKEPFYPYDWFNRKWKNTLFTNAHIRFVNGEYRGNDALGKLMHDFHCTNPDDMFYDELKEAVSYFKKDEEGVRIMCEIMNSAKKRWQSEAWAEGRIQGIEKGRAEGIEKGRAEGRARERKKARRQLETTMRNLHEDGMSIEKIARMTSQPVSRVEAFFSR